MAKAPEHIYCKDWGKTEPLMKEGEKDADETNTVLKAASFVPMPLGVPGAKAAILKATELATGKSVFSGEVTAEMKLTDAQSGDILCAAMDRRVGARHGGGWEVRGAIRSNPTRGTRS